MTWIDFVQTPRQLGYVKIRWDSVSEFKEAKEPWRNELELISDGYEYSWPRI